MDWIAKARRLRPLIEKAAVSLEDKDALEAVELFPAWKSGTQYKAGDRVRYDGALYECVQGHVSQDDWTPDVTPALWKAVADPAVEWPEWVQPAGAHDAYKAGDKVSHNEKHWVSDVDNNVWEPGVAMWTEAA